MSSRTKPPRIFVVWLQLRGATIILQRDFEIVRQLGNHSESQVRWIKLRILFEDLLETALRLAQPAVMEIDHRDAKLRVQRRWLERKRLLIHLDGLAQPGGAAVVPLVHRRVCFG